MSYIRFLNVKLTEFFKTSFPVCEKDYLQIANMIHAESVYSKRLHYKIFVNFQTPAKAWF